jgi:NTE family protein
MRRFSREAFLCRLASVLVSACFLLPSTAAAQSNLVIRPQFTKPTCGGPFNLAPKEIRRPKVGLVLTGGGARGIVHIGVLKVLEQRNIPIDFIAGNSIGAIVGGLYAAGYSVAELESLVLHTNWNDLLSLTEDTRRTELYLDQKQAQEQGFLLIRLEGLEPVIPSSLSSGQRLTNFLTTLTMQALYHPNPSFDDLKIPFRVVATDLVSGRRAVLSKGSLAEALRASVTVPLLFTPLELDSMSLVDGGLVSNAPVDLARNAGCDVVITSNATSGMRTPDQLQAPWETADQIMSIMMQYANEMQLRNSDLVLTPVLGNHLSSDFTGLDSLISLGKQEAEQHITEIAALVESHRHSTAFAVSSQPASNSVTTLTDTGAESELRFDQPPAVSFAGDEIPPDLLNEILERASRGELTLHQIENDLEAIFEAGGYDDVYAEVTRGSASSVTYHVQSSPLLRHVSFRGNTAVTTEQISEKFGRLINRPMDYGAITRCLEQVLAEYRTKGYSLARIDPVSFDAATGTLHFVLEEGIIQGIRVEGNVYTKEYVIRREFSLVCLEAFNITKARRGMVNINSTGLFEYVLLDMINAPEGPIIVLKVKEKGANNIRLGAHADNERGLQGSIDLRDPNFFGTATELGFKFAAGIGNRLYRLEYRADRIFDTYLTFNFRTYYRFDDVYTYNDASSIDPRRWERLNVGEYRQIRYGATMAFGVQLERLGNLTTELRMENVETRTLTGITPLPDRFQLITLKLGTVIDTEDRFPFPNSGMMLSLNYEAAMKQLGSDGSFGRLSAAYEAYLRLLPRHTIRPKVTIGVADATLPLSEQFSIGGLSSFFGLRDDDRRGRQLFSFNMLYRVWLPFKVVFESYLHLRYDLAMISELPEEIDIGKFHHGIGAELSLDTPIGPASFGVGRSFYLRKDVAGKPFSTGPALFYFTIGYRI